MALSDPAGIERNAMTLCGKNMNVYTYVTRVKDTIYLLLIALAVLKPANIFVMNVEINEKY